MSRFIVNKLSSRVHILIVRRQQHRKSLSDPNQLITSTSTFHSGNRSGDYVSQIFPSGLFRARFYRMAACFHVSDGSVGCGERVWARDGAVFQSARFSRLEEKPGNSDDLVVHPRRNAWSSGESSNPGVSASVASSFQLYENPCMRGRACFFPSGLLYVKDGSTAEGPCFFRSTLPLFADRRL
jgi:hypothetical protein